MRNSNRIVLINILSTVIIQGLAFLTAPIFSRLLGTENYGIVSVYTTWTLIASAIFSLQADSTLQVARNKFPEEDQPKYHSSMLFLITVSYVAFSAVIMLFLEPLSELIKLPKEMIPVVIIHSYGQVCMNLMVTRNTYEFRAGRNFILSVFASVCTIGLSMLLVFNMPQETNYWGRIMGQAITYVILAVVSWLAVFPKGKTFFNREYWRFCLPISIPVIFHMLSNHVLGQSDRLMLQYMGTNSMVGIYSLAASFSVVLNVIWSALNNSWVPFYFDYTRNGQIDEMKKRAKNYLELYTVLASGFVLLATEVYHMFAGKEYWDGTILIPIFAVGYYMVFLYSFPVNYEFYRQKTAVVATGTILAAVCNIVLNYVLIQRMDYTGAALATAIAHTLQFLFHYVCARHFLGKGDFPFSMRDFLPYALPFIALAVFSACVQGLWWLRWGMGAVLGVWELLRIIKRKSIF